MGRSYDNRLTDERGRARATRNKESTNGGPGVRLGSQRNAVVLIKDRLGAYLGKPF